MVLLYFILQCGDKACSNVLYLVEDGIGYIVDGELEISTNKHKTHEGEQVFYHICYCLYCNESSFVYNCDQNYEKSSISEDQILKVAKRCEECGEELVTGSQLVQYARLREKTRFYNFPPLKDREKAVKCPKCKKADLELKTIMRGHYASF